MIWTLVALVLAPIVAFASEVERNGSKRTIELGFDSIMVKIVPIEKDIKTFDANKFNREIEVFCSTFPIFSTGHEDYGEVTKLTYELSPTGVPYYHGLVPTQTCEEIGGVFTCKNGELIGGTHLLLKRGRNNTLTLHVNNDGEIAYIEYPDDDEMNLKDWMTCADVSMKAIMMTPSDYIPSDKELYTSWKNVRDYQMEKLWPRYVATILSQPVNEKMSIWLNNSIKTRFAREYILTYVKGAKEFAGLDVETPPMEAYSFLDSIDYSPEVFLKTPMYMPIKDLLAGILKWCEVDDIGDNPVGKWQDYAYAKLQPAIKERHPLLLDLLAGMSYVNQIEDGKPLTNIQIRNIRKGFSDDIGKIVLEENQRRIAIGQPTLHDLTDKAFDLREFIDKNYRDRHVVVNVQNTWVIPGFVEMSSEIDNARASHREADVVFIYVCDESTEYDLWVERSKKLGGEQVRIGKNAMKALLEEYGLTGMPSYIIFDKEHNLRHKHFGAPTPKEYREALDKLTE